MVAVMLTVTAGSAYLGAAVVARHRAQAAADLAALAAAARLPAGAESACAQAAAVTRAMGNTVVGCAIDDLDVVITIEAGVGTWGEARAAARAGPAQPGSPAAASSAGVGCRSETRPAKVPVSSSTRFAVTCTGTHPPS